MLKIWKTIVCFSVYKKKTGRLKQSHLVDHFDLSEGQPVQPVHLHHVSLPMGLRQLDQRQSGKKEEEEDILVTAEDMNVQPNMNCPQQGVLVCKQLH